MVYLTLLLVLVLLALLAQFHVPQKRSSLSFGQRFDQSVHFTFQNLLLPGRRFGRHDGHLFGRLQALGATPLFARAVLAGHMVGFLYRSLIATIKRIKLIKFISESNHLTHRMHVFAWDSGLYFLYRIFHSICCLQRSQTSFTWSWLIRFIWGVLSCRSFLKAKVFLCFCARCLVRPAPRAELIFDVCGVLGQQPVWSEGIDAGNSDYSLEQNNNITPLLWEKHFAMRFLGWIFKLLYFEWHVS